MTDPSVKQFTEKRLDPKDWHPQQAKLLKNWAEIASSYRWMHNQAYMIYKKKNIWFMLPLIIMSTVSGTANFAQSTFPETIRPYVPQIIGAINLISAIMTTIYQFLKISEFMESHRISSINYGKLARTITIELNLPVKDRNSGGAECVKISRNEIDRLIEQSPAIPKNVLYIYERQFSGKGLSEPEIIVINKVDIYEDQENKAAMVVKDAGIKFKEALAKLKKPLFSVKTSESPTEKRKETINKELDNLQSSKLVSMINTGNVGSAISSVLNRFSPKKRSFPPKIPIFTDIPEELHDLPETLPSYPIILEHGTDLTPDPDPETPINLIDTSDTNDTNDIESGENITPSVASLIGKFKL